MRLDGKVMLVTGATSGIGAAIALESAKEGARLFLTGRSAERGESIRKQCGRDAAFMTANVAERGAAERLIDATVKQFGRLDVLVNNAGIVHRHTAETATDEEWDQVIATNVTAVFRMSRAALRQMKRQGGGTIINIGSDWALVGGRNAFAYCASKGAVAQMTRAMAVDYARDNIRVNCICPGDIDTPMLASGIAKRGMSHEQGIKSLADQIPMGRVAQPEEIGRAAVFLASSDSSFMTGAMLSVDGGSTAA
jgi:meso-butanediol dehydrogenase / (S,S)-butanediol dehydrogenase / diacetyl reductase